LGARSLNYNREKRFEETWAVECREKKEKKKSKGTTADKPNKTVNIDLCFVPVKETQEPDFSFFFNKMDSFCENASEKMKKLMINIKIMV